MGRYLKNRELESASYSVRIPNSKSTQGPEAPVDGLIRYNITTGRPEAYFNNKWRSLQGNELNLPVKDVFYGDGGKTNFSDMTFAYPTGNEIFLLVFIHNVFQNPGVAYTVNGKIISFTSPPPRNHPIIILHGLVNGSPFEPLISQPLPPSPIIVTPITTSTTTTTTSTTTTTTAAPFVGLNNFVNGDFANTSATYSNLVTSLEGWKIYHSGVRLNGYSNFLNCPTPSVRDVTPIDYEHRDELSASGFYSTDFVQETVPGYSQDNALRLMLVGTTFKEMNIVRGPILVSENYVNISGGDRIQFWWKAFNRPLSFYVDENYDICAYLLSSTGCKTIVLLKATGSTTDWSKVEKSFTAADAGSYKFVFVSGSVDSNGSKTVGSQVYLDKIELIK